jgi:hypothetical protein
MLPLHARTPVEATAMWVPQPEAGRGGLARKKTKKRGRWAESGRELGCDRRKSAQGCSVSFSFSPFFVFIFYFISYFNSNPGLNFKFLN